MNDIPTPPLQTTGSTVIAANEVIIHVALPQQLPPTPLGSLRKLPLEVRNQIYREIFVQAKVHLKAQRPGPNLGVSPQVLEVSKALRFEALPRFYQHCQFRFNVRYLRPDPALEDFDPALQKQIPLMRRVVFRATVADLHALQSPESSKSLAVVLMRSKAGNGDYYTRIPELFEKTSCQGQQMLLNATVGLAPAPPWWRDTNIASLLDVVGFFRGFHTVRVWLRITKDDYTEQISHQLGSGLLSPCCSNVCNKLQGRVAAALGPGVHVEEEVEGYLYSDSMEYHPRLYLEARQGEVVEELGSEEER